MKNDEFHFKSTIVAGGSLLNLPITGKAKYVMYVEDRGYARLNYDPSTMEVLTNSSMVSANVFDDASFVNDPSFAFVCNDGNIQSTDTISGTGRYLWVIYTLE